MVNIKDKLKRFAFSKGADLVGIAPVNRFHEAPEGHRPTDILAEGKTVIVCAKKIPESVLTSGPATSYHQTMVVLHNQLDIIAYEVAAFVEKCGGKAIPIPADEFHFDWNQERLHGRGDLSHKHAAQAAGLGKLGKNSLLIAPELGNRVHLVSVVTNLELDPDPLVAREMCLPACTLCMTASPVKAIQNGVVDQKKCRSHVFPELPKGLTIEACRECRKACASR